MSEAPICPLLCLPAVYLGIAGRLSLTGDLVRIF